MIIINDCKEFSSTKMTVKNTVNTERNHDSLQRTMCNTAASTVESRIHILHRNSYLQYVNAHIATFHSSV